MKRKDKSKNNIKPKDIFLVLSVVIFTTLCIFWGMPVMKYGFIGWPFILFFTGVIVFLFDLDEDGDLAGSWRLHTGWISMAVAFLFFALKLI